MRYWVQFLETSAEEPTKLIDALGDTAFFILDGRNSSETMRRDALKRAQRLEHWRKFAAFQIVTGERFTEEKRRGPVHRLSYPIQGAA
jgi:hypothetical protein